MNYKKIFKKSGYTEEIIASEMGVSLLLFNNYMNGTMKMPMVIQKRLKAVIERLETDAIIHMEEWDLEHSNDF